MKATGESQLAGGLPAIAAVSILAGIAACTNSADKSVGIGQAEGDETAPGPTAPAKVTAVASSASHFTVSWDNVDGESAYLVYRRAAESRTWTEIARLPPDTVSMESTGVLERARYVHCVRAAAAAIVSDCTQSAAATTLARFATARGRVIAPRTAQYPRAGEGSIVAHGGRLLYVYGRYEGSGDYAHATIALRTSANGGAAWSAERVAFVSEHQLALPALAELDTNTIGLSYVEIVDEATARRVFRTSSDGGRSWSDPVGVSDASYPYMTGSHDRLLRLSNGRLLYPVHARLPAGDLATFVFASDDRGGTWTRQNAQPLRVPAVAYENGFDHGFWEAAIVETRPDRLLMLARTRTGWLYESRSDDAGKTWREPTRSNVIAPTAPSNLLALPAHDALLLAWAPNFRPGAGGGGERVVLASMVSGDAGSTWGDYRQIEYTGNDWFAYPSLYLDRDGAVHMTYYGENDAHGDSRGAGNIFGGSRYLKLSQAWFFEEPIYPDCCQ